MIQHMGQDAMGLVLVDVPQRTLIYVDTCFLSLILPHNAASRADR